MRDLINKIYKNNGVKVLGIIVIMVSLLGVFNIEREEVIDKEKVDSKKQIENIKSVGAATCDVTAKLYDDVACTGTGIDLTTAGADVLGWKYDTSKYLYITVSTNISDGKEHMVEINLPKELYFVTADVNYLPSGFKSVSFTKNTPETITTMNGHGL